MAYIFSATLKTIFTTSMRLKRRTMIGLGKLSLFPVVFCNYDKDELKKIKFQTSKELSHEYLIQQASSQTMNAVSQLLTQTVVAVCDVADQYIEALTELLSLVDESQLKMHDEMSVQDLSDMMVEARAKAFDYQKQFLELVSLMSYVEKVAVATAETCFLAGSDFISISLSERLNSAKLEVDRKRDDIKKLEKECLRFQLNLIETLKDDFIGDVMS